MTTLRLSDLPPKVREHLEHELDRQEQIRAKYETPRRAKSRKGISDRVACPGRCGTCGQEFASAHLWELHCKAVHAGNGRWDIDLD